MEGTTTANNNNSTISEVDLPHVMVTPVLKLQHEQNETPVSSAGEDDDAKDFHEMLKEDSSWKPPSPELETKIRSLLEHYFSDENLIKDKFLLKHVKRNRLGYVSVKLLTSFKKLKNLSRSDWKITAYSLSKSTKLELNKPGTKVRRKDPLPEIDLPTTSIRTLLYKLPDDANDPTINRMSEQFRLFGELTTVRIIRPDKEVPLDLRNHTSKHPELGTTTCVVVEFENTEAAQNAYKTLSKKAREEEKPDMYSLLGSGRNPRKQAGKGFKRDGLYYDSSEDSANFSSRENSPMMRRKFQNPKNGVAVKSSPLISPHGSRDASPEKNNSKSPRSSPNFPRKNMAFSSQSNSAGNLWISRKSRDNTPDSSPRNSPLTNRKQSNKLLAHQKTTSPLAINNNLLSPSDSVSAGSTPTGGSSPWLQRRRQFVASQGNSPCATPGSSPLLGRKFQDGVPVGVTRLPRGPPNQNAKGFESILHRQIKTDVDTLKDQLQAAIIN
ncbi:la-related protein 6-like isoform X2 [Clavelina lepadiformis]|uniref:la-related protein 6-like isoform X2 n=1 Tax=Clavelina lepadiformis TaxID=159417 RepID=UPI00404372BC